MYEEILLIQDKPMRASAVGRIRALESRLLTSDFINRLIDSTSLNEALQILGESPDYQPTIGALPSSNEWEKALQGHFNEVVVLSGLLAEKSLGITAFRLKWDVHNAKTILKSSLAKPSLAPRFSEAGNWKIDSIRMGIEENRWEPPCDKYIAPIVEAGRKTFEQTKDIQAIELAMDRAEMEMTISMLPSKKPYFLFFYFQARIDLANLRITLRLRNLKKEKQYAVFAIAEGGKVNTSAYLDSWDEPLSSLVSRLSRTSLDYVFTSSGDTEKEDFLEDAEKAGMLLRTRFALLARRIPFGLPPVAGYLFAKENEIAMLRAILSGKTNGLSSDAIRKLLWN